MNLQSLKIKASTMKARLGVLYWAFHDKRTPWYAKVLIVMVIAYALSPIDLIPDFIPILGYLDDLILIPAGIAWAIKLIPEEVLLECSEKQISLNKVNSYGLYGGIMVIAVWVLLIYFIIQSFNT